MEISVRLRMVNSMKTPFSALYFIKENKSRCILLMFMLFLGYGAYLAGLYVTNPYDNWRVGIEYYNDMVSINATTNDKDKQEFEAFKAEALKDNKVKIIDMGSYNGFSWNTVMGFEMGQCTFTFHSVDDFKTFCEFHNIDCDFENIKNGSLVLSEKFAKNIGLEIGNKVDKDYGSNIYGEFTLDVITNEDGYISYFIDENSEVVECLLLGEEIKGKELYDYAYGLQEKYDVYVYKGLYNDMRGQFSMFDTIYMFVVILMAIIMAVTINAAFVGMYQRRNFEFAVYRAIGISKRRIIGKIAKELLCMDLVALTVGGGVFFTMLYLFNNMVLYPAGKYLNYFHSLALIGMVLCNIMVVIPLIITRCKRLLKADICEY